MTDRGRRSGNNHIRQRELLLTKFLDPCPPDFVFRRLVDDQRKSVNGLAVQQECHLRELARPVPGIFIAVDRTLSMICLPTNERRATDSKLANPELLLFSLSKKLVTISPSGTMQVKMMRAS